MAYTIEEVRTKVNNVSTVEELVNNVLCCYGIKDTCFNKNFCLIRVKGYTIVWSKAFDILYVTRQGEVILYDTGEALTEKAKNFILDSILELNTDTFYKFFFQRYGYRIEENTSEVTREILEHFTENRAIINNIFTNEDYRSMTITGTRYTNNNEIEYRVVNCDKQDILDLISVTRIQPQINRKNTLEFENPYHNRPFITDSDIMDCYNEYKDSISAYD